MPKEKQTFQYYLFSFSNFIAAFGGGLILGKGVSVINAPLLQGGSILAFFIGTVLGLIFLQAIPKKISKTLARWFSIFATFASLGLIGIFEKYANNGVLINIPAYLFFVLLSIRFAFWFYSRVLRAANVAGQEQRIAWVELGYYSGMILGLIFWKFPGIEMGILAALIIDAFVQFCAGCIDLYAHQISINQFAKNLSAKETADTSLYNKVYPSRNWCLRLAFVVMLLTIGVQVIIFNLTHHVSEYFGSYILATFYFGVSIAAFVCKKLKIYLEWNYLSATIYFGKDTEKKKVNFFILATLALTCVAITILGVDTWSWEKHNESMLILLFVCTAAFFYEILSLAMLDRIGLEERYFNKSGMIIRTYGLMGIGASISLWLLSITSASPFGLLVTLAICFVIATSLIWKRTIPMPTQNVAVSELK